jgi:hypothetical protein
VDSAGDLWVSTGNGGSGTAFGYHESVLRLDPSMDVFDFWAPSNWQDLDSHDTDLGSSDPVLLPGGLMFQMGKAGVGYLLSASKLGGEGANAAYQSHQICKWEPGRRGLLQRDHLRELLGRPAGIGPEHIRAELLPGRGLAGQLGDQRPPIIAGGLVWVTDWNNNRLYGLNPQTGQAAVNQSTPSMEHFTIPAASDGKLFLASGDTVEAYTIANPVTAATAPPPTVSPARCVLKLRTRRVRVYHPKRRKHHKHAPVAYATVALSRAATRPPRSS